jgi:hypothetical protein
LLDNVAEPDAKTALERVDQLVFGVNVQRRTFAGCGDRFQRRDRAAGFRGGCLECQDSAHRVLD